ncbi:tetratricopeptide repeat protein [Salinithrix halophila]|uniref:Tetratricopeptide repeat protein n=1 Tax=Salinithrix halophila TaxID=1485204 RepID=A0ABV8JCE4_9BACL
MSAIKINEIGEVIRKIRKEKGFRLEDLADENISPATISNIERGVPHVNTNKIQYLLDKLGVNLMDIPSKMEEEANKMKDVEFQLDSSHLLWSLGQLREALYNLEKLELDDAHPLAPRKHFLKGRCYLTEKKWAKAERELYYAIKLSSQSPLSQATSVEALCFNDLAICCYQQNEIEKALGFTNQAIDSYQESGDAPHLKFVLRCNKAIYLDKLDRVNEGMQTIQEVWDSIDSEVESKHIALLYWLKAEFLRKMGILDQALHHAQQGLEMSRRNGYNKSILDFLNTMGSIFSKAGDWKKAKDCFRIAINAREMFGDTRALATTYTRLGVLYMNESNWDEAKKTLEEAVNLSQDDLVRLSYALLFLGDFYKKQGQIQEAVSYYERTLEIIGSRNPRLEAKLHLRLASIWDQADEKEFQKHLRNMYEIKMMRERKEVDIFDEME